MSDSETIVTQEWIDRLQAALPDERLHWDETPLELITRLIKLNLLWYLLV
jgi:hypothetical protein